MGSSPWLRTGLFAIIIAALAGCTADPFDRAALGKMNSQAIGQLLGPGAVQTSDGYSLDLQQPWPTVIHLIHVAAPEGAAARWKLDFAGRVVHLLAFQTVSVSVAYEGPLSPELLKGLRSATPDNANEFLSDFVGFVQAKVHDSMTAKWTDAAALRDDRYRSRFLGLLDVTTAALKGQGRLDRSRFSVDVTGAAGSSLTLRYLGDDVYRIELSGAVSLAPLPVL